MIEIRIEVEDLKEIEKIFNTTELHSGIIINPSDNFSVTFNIATKKTSLSTTSILVDLAVNYSLGVSASLLATFLYEKFTNKGQKRIIIKKKRKILIKKKDIEIYIEEEIKSIRKEE